MIVSDSFWWKVYDQNIQRDYFGVGTEFWYYCSEAYSRNWEGPRPLKNYNVLKSLDQVDLVLLMANEGNLHELGWGFVDALGKVFYEQSLKQN